jgi:hypothetical protein
MGNMQSRCPDRSQNTRWDRNADFQSAVSQVFNLPLDRLPGLRYFQMAELTRFHRGDGGLD